MASKKHIDLRAIRTEIGMSQSEFGDMIGISERTVQSYEQGLRNPSPPIEKAALLLLLAHRHGSDLGLHVCWDVINCSEDERKGCLVYRSKQGHLCWLMTGNICQGVRHRSWEQKKEACMECAFFRALLSEGLPMREEPG